ncbi:MAG: HgcAB-associated protein HgcC [Candidatus Aminicenantales bacterium]
MDAKSSSRDSAGTMPEACQCCSVESVVTVDERGQMVLPKEVREKAGILPGDKLVIVSMESGGTSCCLTLIKAERLEDMVHDLILPGQERLPKTRKKTQAQT